MSVTDIEIVYPPSTRTSRRFEKFKHAARWIFVLSAYACVIVNICMGGKPWSVVALWSMWYVWALFIARDLVEYNRISQSVKTLLYSCILLVLIDLCLSSGWAGFVVPIVCFGSLAIVGVLFFTNLPRQKQNVMPMLWMIGAALVALIAALIGWPEMNWPMIALGSTAAALLLIIIVVLPGDLLREIKKRFHLK